MTYVCVTLFEFCGRWDVDAGGDVSDLDVVGDVCGVDERVYMLPVMYVM